MVDRGRVRVRVRVREGMAWKIKCLKQYSDFVEFCGGGSFAFRLVLRVGLRLDLITTGSRCERVYP